MPDCWWHRVAKWSWVLPRTLPIVSICSMSYFTYQLSKRSANSVPSVTPGKSIRSYPKRLHLGGLFSFQMCTWRMPSLDAVTPYVPGSASAPQLLNQRALCMRADRSESPLSWTSGSSATQEGTGKKFLEVLWIPIEEQNKEITTSNQLAANIYKTIAPLRSKKKKKGATSLLLLQKETSKSVS